MSDDLYSLSGAIISLNKKTQPAKQMAGLYNKHVDFRDFASIAKICLLFVYRDPPSVFTVSEFIGIFRDYKTLFAYTQFKISTR